MPAVHSAHVPAPAFVLKKPAAQSLHVLWPPNVWKAPGLQSVCAVEPVEQYEPAGHVVHWLLLPSPGVLEYEPSKHGSGAEAPASQ